MNLVIGSGISGLIAGYILGWPVIGKEVGGQMKSPFPLGPRILETTGETRWLLTKLGLGDREHKFYDVGYKDKNGQVHDTPDDAFRKAYYEKTRLNGEEVNHIPSSIMTGGRNSLIGWDMQELRLIEKLRSHVALIPTNVTSIFTSRKELNLEDGTSLKYDNLVSTIPLNILDSIVGNPFKLMEFDFKTYDTVFVMAHAYDEIFSPTEYKDYVYVADKSIPHHRITRIGTDQYVYEYRGDRYPGAFHTDHLYFAPKAKHILKNCQIINDLKLDNVLGIKLIGRYSEWYHGCKTEDVIRRVLQYAEQVGAFGK